MKFLIFFLSNYTYFYFTYGNKFWKEGFFRWPFVKKNHLAVNFPPPGWTPFWSWYQDRLLNSSSLMYCDLITCYHEMKNHLIFGDEKNKLIFLNIKIHVQLAYVPSFIWTLYWQLKNLVYVGIESTPHILKPYLHVRTLIHAQYTLYSL